MAKLRFPIKTGDRNWKAIRENLLLDSTGNGVEDQLFQGAEAAKGPNQSVYVSRGYSKSGRLSVWIVDESSGDDAERIQGLLGALGRFRV